ncbi:lipase family protein [Mastigocoleus testarum]|uniref:Fungal lipase-type domain-containing protein n=1 Tax=Mastigocoleus testarum BC008 TaxID=371196 RepID=A0A0V8A084_9CYAN|nr:lipase family protein [Mastigocoleus testarum]KST66833.1 hypothetical protein BC008_26960 [Mastigocoleus testarum BC008]KST70170.1 hypothetical protein BC008_36565 [Mastigocoleus testarum BC008]
MSEIYIPSGSSFDLKRAKELAMLVEESYHFYELDQKKETLEPEKTGFLDVDLHTGNVSERLNYSILSTFRFTGFWLTRPETVTFGFIAKRILEDGNVGIFIVFRGTRENQEWYQNLNSNQEDFLGVPELGLVNVGTHKIYTRAVKNRNLHYARLTADGNLSYIKNKSRYPDLISRNGHSEAITETVHKTLTDSTQCPANSQVFITGHSLGAGLATFAALHVATQTKFQPILYTFASPRVAAPNFKEQFTNRNIEYYRIANAEDVVPTLPLANFNFTKVNPIQNFFSRLLFLNQLTLMDIRYQHMGEPIYFSKQLGSILDNHDIITYRKAL